MKKQIIEQLINVLENVYGPDLEFIQFNINNYNISGLYINDENEKEKYLMCTIVGYNDMNVDEFDINDLLILQSNVIKHLYEFILFQRNDLLKMFDITKNK
jgi:hypothetical protein